MKIWNHKKTKVKPNLTTDKSNIITIGNDGEEYEIVEFEILPEKMVCPDCGGITLVGLDFCDKCAGELSNYELN